MTESCTVYRAGELLPREWQHFLEDGPVRIFNPGLLREAGGWLLAYRVVGADGSRRIGLCRLDAALQVVPGSARPFSDHVRFDRDKNYPAQAYTWFADPRLYRLAGRAFAYWNSGWHDPRNCQFLQEFDPATLLPVGHPRELVLDGERRKLEKNWTLFESPDRDLRAVYSVCPHRVLAFALKGQGDLSFNEVSCTDWSVAPYPAPHGGLRGGAPPQLFGGSFWSFCHSVHDAPGGYEYRASAYAFEAALPFRPIRRPIAELALGNPFGLNRVYPRLNTAVGRVTYPCGAAADGDDWLVSFGINDEHAAVTRISHSAVLASTAAV